MNFVSFYPYLKIIHLVALISFMAGMLYLPRLFVYHSMQKLGSGEAKMLEIMEIRLLRYIINPAFVITLFSGLALSNLFIRIPGNYWVHAKFVLFLLLGVVHGFCARYRKKFLISTEFHSSKFFRIFNEIPTIIMILMIILVILKPF